MNERIKELWHQAAEIEFDPSWEGQTRFLEKFAELIVRECADISDASFHDGSAGYLAILNNFGVK